MRDLKTLAFERKPLIGLMGAAAFLKGAGIILQAWLLVWIIDEIFLGGASFEAVVPLLAALAGALFLRAAAGYAISRAGIQLAAEVKTGIRKKLIRSFAASPLQLSMQGQSGKKVSLLLDAVDETDGFFSIYIPQLMQSYLIPLMLLAAIFVLHWPTGVIILLTAPFIPVFMAIVGKRTKAKADSQMAKLSQFSGTFLDVLQGLPTLRLYGQAKKQTDVIRDSSLKFRDATMDVLKSAFLSSFSLEYISMLSIGLIALEIGFELIGFQTISFFTAFFVMILVPEFFTQLKDFGSSFHAARGSLAASEQLQEQLNASGQEVRWGEKPVAAGPPHLTLNQAAFRYAESFTLGPVSAELPAGSHTAIIGRSGSGKTTLLHLLAGLLPVEEGTICVNGTDRAAVDETDWFGQLSYISQHPAIFAGTIRENIAIGTLREVSDRDILEAAEKAGIADLIQSFSRKLDTPIGEGGRGLSGGEKQRLALARAFLKRPSLILFDEPTAGLDLETERILQRSIAELSRQATVITVAHRLHTIRGADQILFLDNGKVTAAGSHGELAESFAPYGDMLVLQQGGSRR